MVVLTPEHGYVILAASGSFLVNFWQMMKIGGKRKELKIEVINFWKRIAIKNYQDWIYYNLKFSEKYKKKPKFNP